ncbi:hypothetical protein ACFV4P_02830 [Kitasatospora sp. NPDC059795]|uniref:hypothetical protein n=1 Tax=Kitasatospora sp. NPDC059795 TaxID=3346949 RepID=UPI00365D2237
MNTLTVLGDQAADTVALTRIPVLLLADEPGPATITASIDGTPRRYTSTTVTYEAGLRCEVHAPGGPSPEEAVRWALPGGDRVARAYLATPGQLTPGVEVRHDGLMARACAWNGRTLLTVTPDRRGEGRMPALRLVGAESLAESRPGHLVLFLADAEPVAPGGREAC